MISSSASFLYANKGSANFYFEIKNKLLTQLIIDPIQRNRFIASFNIVLFFYSV